MTFTPSSYQQEIYAWVKRGRGHGYVNAVAGSGKTTTVVQCAELLDAPGMFCAFNKHIAGELAARLDGTMMEVATIHALGYRALRRHPDYRRAQVNGQKYSAIAHTLVEGAAKRGKLDGKTLTEAQILAIKNEWPVADLVKLADLLRLNLKKVGDHDDIAWVCDHHGMDFHVSVYPLVPRFLRAMLREGRMLATVEVDFTDMLWIPLTVKRGAAFDQYQWVFVDEAQDLNAAQLEVVRRTIAPDGRALFVGDERQAIYGFAGADSDSIARIVQVMDCTELPLSICYRCPTTVIELAQKYVPQIEAAPGAPEGIVDEVGAREVATALRKGDLVLCRVTAPLLSLCYHLISSGVSAGVQGRDIGKGLTKVIEEVRKITPEYDRFQDGLREWERQHIERLMRRRGDTGSQIQTVQDRVACLDVLYAAVRQPEEGEEGYDMLCAHVTGLFASVNPDIQLSTVHRAKGLERKRVFILRPDLMPHPLAKRAWQVKQEQNLIYVAYTRAQEALVFVREDQDGLRERAQ